MALWIAHRVILRVPQANSVVLRSVLNINPYSASKISRDLFVQILSGNSDTATVVSHRLMPPVYTSKVRVLPYSVHRRTVCLRVELRGCLAEGECRIVLALLSHIHINYVEILMINSHNPVI
jgi:hypothetical protein